MFWYKLHALVDEGTGETLFSKAESNMTALVPYYRLKRRRGRGSRK